MVPTSKIVTEIRALAIIYSDMIIRKDIIHCCYYVRRRGSTHTLCEDCRKNYNRLLRMKYMYESNYQVYVALFKSVILMKDFRITILLDKS